PTNVGEGLVIMLAILLGTTLPILPVQALWINMTTALFLGLMLAFEPKEEGVMERSPRDINEPILNTAMLSRIFLISFLLLGGAFGIFTWSIQNGSSIEEARTLAVTLFVVVQSFYLLNCRLLKESIFKVDLFSNKWIWIGMAMMFIVQFLFIYTPFMNRVFQSASIDFGSWVLLILYGIFSVFVIELEKFIWNLFSRK
ncbi:MAG: cation transporting ATPase C-terminal domain-containing protein, partial [Arcobacteraceae bacterium]